MLFRLYQNNLTPSPPNPPDHIVTENDRIKQSNYEDWLNSTSAKLNNQLKYYETEKAKIQKAKKVGGFENVICFIYFCL